MKKTLIALAVAAGITAAYAQTEVTTTTTTLGNGTVTEYTPGSALVVTESGTPIRYRYGETVTYVTRKGRVLTPEQAAMRIRVGIPVAVSYVTEGRDRIVNRIEVDDDDGEIEIDND